MDYLKKIAHWLIQPGWRQNGVLFFVGALTCLGDAPFGIAIIPIICLAILIWSCQQISVRQSVLRAWFFGLGFYGFGVSWVYVAMNVFGHMAMPIAGFFTLLLVAYMALFSALAMAMVRYFSMLPQVYSILLLFPAAWALSEWFRSWLFTGFPWLLVGYSQLDWPISGFAPWIGVYGLSFLTALMSALLLLVFISKQKRYYYSAAFIVLLVAGFLLNFISWGNPVGKEFKVTVLQGNIPQEDKWKPGQLNKTIGIYTEMIRASLQSDIIVLPENALPVFYHKIEDEYLQHLNNLANQFNTAIVLGLPIKDIGTGEYFNGIVVVGKGNGRFKKHHLVPFGEYIPLKSIIGDLLRIMDIPMADFSKGAAMQDLPVVHDQSLGVTVCYEDAYVGEVNKKLPQASLLVNGSNNAWYGNSLAPHQHLRISRMRAKETARDIMRATTNGISAIIDYTGRIKVKTPQFRRSGIHGTVQGRQGSTPFVMIGNLSVMTVIFLVYLAPILWYKRVMAKP